MNTWKIVTRPRGERIRTSKWVFRIKEDGNYKARLVAVRYSQENGIDYNETFFARDSFKKFNNVASDREQRTITHERIRR